MPFESDKQRKAMYASASGKGTSGIPKHVAKKFIKDSGGEVKKKTKKKHTAKRVY